MKIAHTLTVAAICPKDEMPDRYRCIVTTPVVIPVEDILEVVSECSSMKIYQEDLCQHLHRKLNACVTLTGWHSGVKTIVTCGDYDS